MSKIIQVKNKPIITVGVTVPENRLKSIRKYYHFINSIIDLPIELSFNDFILHMVVSRIVSLEKSDKEIKVLKSIANKTAFLPLRMTSDFYKKLLIIGSKVTDYLNENGKEVIGINKFLKENLALYIASTINEFGNFYNLLNSLIYFHFLEIINEIFGEMITPDEKIKMLKNLEFPKILRDGRSVFHDFLLLISPKKEIIWVKEVNKKNEPREEIISKLVSFLNKNNEMSLKEYTELKLNSELYNIESKHTELLSLCSLINSSDNYNDKFNIEQLLILLANIRSDIYTYKKLEELPASDFVEKLSFTDIVENYKLCESSSKKLYTLLRYYFVGNKDQEEMNRLDAQRSSDELYSRIASLLLS
ncbi:MAG: hypothetical protein QXP59_07635 [Saccharolobus sp.]